MRLKINPLTVQLWLSGCDTYNWARREGAVWPGSQLSGSRLFVEFDSNGLLDYAVDGTQSDPDVNELNAMTADFLATRLPTTHPAYRVAVEQFQH